MQFSAYPSIKQTNLDWIGSLPEHWEAKKLKFVCNFGTGWTPPTKDERYFYGENLWATIGDMENRYIEETALTISDDAIEEFKMYQVPKGSLLYSFKLSVGKVAFVAKPMYTNEAIFYVLPDNSYCIEFLYYLFPVAIIENANENIYGAKILNQEKIKNAFLTFPPVTEQQKIATFLDYKTQQIDQLIEKKKTLIEKLEEKRIAVITQAVTKGLDKNAKLKPSGVDWLGDVPGHWLVCDMNYVLEAIGDVDHYMPESLDSGIPYVMTGDLKELASNIDFDKCKQVSYEDYLDLSKKIRTSKGDVIIARYATIGTVSYVDVDAEFLVSYSCVTIKPISSKIFGLYLYYYFKSDAFLQGIQGQINTNTQGNVGVDDLKKLKVAVPPTSEQEKITEYLGVGVSEINKLANCAHATIEKLKEYRSAIIASAVTGRIDVREAEIPKEFT